MARIVIQWKKRKEMDIFKDRELLRLATAGSVDNGKSTLIGRLFYDCNAIYEDQLSGMEKISRKKGLKEIDLSLLTDGLAAEREQGITIDVAHRYFNTPKRRIIIADVPGHEQYTRNMITGVSEADAVLILIDAGQDITIQSKRHLFLSSLLGAPHIIIAVNKMDMVGYSQAVFEKIKNDFTGYAAKLNIKDLEFIPVSALKGDMVVQRGDHMPWYGGDTLLYYLESIPFTSRNLIDFRLPVQTVVRAEKGFRGYAGKIEGGIIKEGDEVMILPSEKKSKIKSILVGGKKVMYAFSPQSVLINLSQEIDVSRGDMIVREHNQPEMNNELEAMICCLIDEPLRQGKSYLIKHSTKTSRVVIDIIDYRLNIQTLHREKTNLLHANEIGRVVLTSTKRLIYDTFVKNRNTGSFILIDEITKNTVAAGIVLDKGKRPTKKNKKPDTGSRKSGAVLWFTGLSQSGKSTIANKVYKILKERGLRAERLDGDIVRRSLTKDLSFSKEDRDDNIERVAFVAKLLSRNGVIVVASFISPYKKERLKARKEVEKEAKFIEIYCKCPLEVCEKRDTKGLYKKARRGTIENFTGISDPYEEPKNPEVIINTHKDNVEKCVKKIIDFLQHEQVFKS